MNATGGTRAHVRDGGETADDAVDGHLHNGTTHHGGQDTVGQQGRGLE